MIEEPDVVDLLIADHAEIRTLIDALDAAETPEVRGCFIAFAGALLAHEAVEQHVVYPALAATYQPAGRLDEHDEINSLLDEMSALPPTSWQFEKRESAVALEVCAHFEREERDVFPLLRLLFDRDRLLELAGEARRVKAAAPVLPIPRHAVA